MKKPGTLFLIPTYLSEDHPDILSREVIDILHSLDQFIVENEKSARKFLKLIKTPVPQSSLKLELLNEHTSAAELPSLMKPLLEGKNIGLMSEAGCPGVADPGSEIVRRAHDAGIPVKPLTGPSSILLSLMGSGLNGQQFAFHGYLPREQNTRRLAIRDLEKEMGRKNQTQIFIETPYRNEKMLDDILSVCHPETRLCISCELTSPREFIRTKTIRDWKKDIPLLKDRVCVFILGT